MDYRNSKKKRVFAGVIVIILVAAMILSLVLAAF